MLVHFILPSSQIDNAFVPSGLRWSGETPRQEACYWQNHLLKIQKLGNQCSHHIYRLVNCDILIFGRRNNKLNYSLVLKVLPKCIFILFVKRFCVHLWYLNKEHILNCWSFCGYWLIFKWKFLVAYLEKCQ